MNEKTYLNTSIKHFSLGMLLNTATILIGLTILEMFHSSFNIGFKEYQIGLVLAIIVPPIAFFNIVDKLVSIFLGE